MADAYPDLLDLHDFGDVLGDRMGDRTPTRTLPFRHTVSYCIVTSSVTGHRDVVQLQEQFLLPRTVAAPPVPP